MINILQNTDGGLITAGNSAVVFIDHQPQMAFGVANIERQQLINNVVMLAKSAKEFGVPAILTAVETESFSGYIWPQLMDVFPDQQPIEGTSMNSWEDLAESDAYILDVREPYEFKRGHVKNAVNIHLGGLRERM
jgi:nicotinamidase-related amidase